MSQNSSAADNASDLKNEPIMFSPSAHAYSTVLEGEAIVLNLENGRYYSLNGTGTMLWERLSKGCSTKSLLHSLKERGNISHEKAQQDLRSFLDNLVSEGLINPTGGLANGEQSR